MDDKNRKQNVIINMIQLAIKLLVFLIFTGYIMIWMMMPTTTFWLHWLPDIHAKVNSKYLGKQGVNILIYTFPVLLIATLSCLYLHLEKYHDPYGRSARKGRYLAPWRGLALVKSPVGVVSWTEFSFLLMFIALLVWSFSSYLHEMFKNISKQSAAQTGMNVWEAKLASAALTLGLLGNICLAFLFFPVTRGSSILNLLDISSESIIKYHIWLGHTVMFLFTAHGLCYITLWVNTQQYAEMLEWKKAGVSNLAGEVALLAGIAMWATSSRHIRRKFFELFFYTHHFYVLFIVFFILHVGFSYSCIMLPGFYLFLVDRFLRFLQSQQRVQLVSARVLPCNAVELNFAKHPGLNYNPTSTAFINISGISKLQWHPFTVTSSSAMDPEKLSIVIKSGGSWSHKLYEMLSSPAPPQHLKVSIEGPYGPASTNFLRHDMLVMVSGGSGITPFISIVRELIFISGTSSCKIPKILLVAAFKRSIDLTLLELILPASGTTYDISGLQIDIQAYVTREKNPRNDNQKLSRAIWFKPSPSDRRVYPVLGLNSWLWLGAIISSSFVTYLLLISILTRYHIYPIDHNSDSIYSHSSRSILNILFLCASITMTATTAFIWNKKHNMKEKMQMQSAIAPTAVGSPGASAGIDNAERDLESFPRNSLAHVTKAYRGEKPNLKKIMSECGGSNVKVLVSGPKKMREEVAGICSASASNLHFEAISFSW